MNVAEAIEAHRAALAAEHEADQEANGIDRCPEYIIGHGRAWQKEIAALRRLCRTKCKTPEDVQAKLHYLMRSRIPKDYKPLVECVNSLEYLGTCDDLLGWFPDLLNSLVLPAVKGEKNAR